MDEKSWNAAQVFISYSHTDESRKNDLEKHLAGLKRLGVIECWHDRHILPGDTWEERIDSRLEQSRVILLLISPDFISSNYCYGREMARALELHKLGISRVVPIIIRHTSHWQELPFGHIQALPRDGRPVSSIRPSDKAYKNITDEIANMISELANELESRKEIYNQELGRTRACQDSEEKLLALGTAHNIRVAVTGILGLCDIIMERHPKVKEVNIIKRQAKLISDIASSVLSREDILTRAPSDVDIEILLKEEMLILDNDLFAKYNVTKNVNIKTPLPKIHGIHSDFSQIISNILRNAIESMRDSTDRRLELEAECKDDTIVISISDTGCGITEEIRERIFDPGFSTKQREISSGGTPLGRGLGLASCKKIIQKYDGDIALSSAPAKGTCFKVTIPINEQAEQAIGAEEIEQGEFTIAQKQVRRRSASTKRNTRQDDKKLVLIVDDDEVIRDLIANFCRFTGCSTIQAENGQKALEQFMRHDPDLVITDIHMPIMNGFQLLRAIRRMNDHTPVVFMTGFAHFRRFFEDKAARADGFYEKPFRVEQLDEILKLFLFKDEES